MRNPSDAMTLTFYCQSSCSDLSEPGVCPTYLTYGDLPFTQAFWLSNSSNQEVVYVNCLGRVKW